ncbi:hypothetical protein [Acinetobacter baumannii]|uniref:hypothetical protein n=1 Tax=Acinetobacter baumannii TaxID=470 RepID=UPI001AAF986A|nr:hypothetical protein [Acinetobacter baumannii]MBO2842449.1 hypothetical protein [Acinetobacter baumannii]
MSYQIKNVILCIIVFAFLFFLLSKGISWWTHHKLIKENDDRIAFALKNNNVDKCAVISNAISMANNLTDQHALDRYKKISIENYCSSSNDIAPLEAATYAEQQAQESVKNTMGYKLISIADQGRDVSIDDPRVSALNGKLESLSNQTGMSEENIADISYYFEKEIKKGNKKSDIDEILEVISMGVDNKACELQTEKTKECISSLLATYTIARIKANQDHITATHSLKSILDVVNDPEKRAKLEAMINTQ